MSIPEEKLESFSIHNHINITQLHMFKCMKDELKEGEIIISEGFSENLHWNKMKSRQYIGATNNWLCFVQLYITKKVERRNFSTMC